MSSGIDSAARTAFGHASPGDPLRIRVCCLSLPPLVVGYVVCLLSLAEGLVLLLRGAPAGLLENGESPFSGVLRALWVCCGLGDVLVAACLGCLGLWMSRNLMPKYLIWMFKLHETYDIASSRLVALLLSWRALVMVAVAPWAGVALAFAPDSFDRGKFVSYTSVYLFACAYGTWTMMAVYPAAVDAGIETQRRLDRSPLVEEVERHVASVWRYHDRIFGCLQLEPVVWLYAFSLCVISVLQLVKGRSGAWALFTSAPQDSMTMGLERVLLVLAAFFSFCGAAAITFHRDRKRLPSLERRSISAVLVFFVANTIRVAFCVPITCMALVMMNVCGAYVNGLARLSPTNAGSWGKSLACSHEDLGVLAVVTLAAALDVYLAWGVFRLWRHYRHAWPIKRSSPQEYGAASAGAYHAQ